MLQQTLGNIARRRRSFSCRFALAVLSGAFFLSIGFTPHRAAGQDLKKLTRFVEQQTSTGASQKIFREGRDLIGEENWGGAAAKFQGFIDAYPKDPNVDAALYWLAFAQVKQEKFAEADSHLRTLLKRYPRSNWADDARALQVQIAPHLGKVQQIDKVLNENDEEIKIVALQSLFQSNPERGLAYVANMLRPGASDSRRMKEAGIELIRRYGGERTVPLLIEIIRTQTDVQLRNSAIHTLGRTRDERAFEVLLELVRNSAEVEVSKAAVFAISRFEGEKARATLIEMARGAKSKEVRKDAIFWLSGQADDAILDEILRIFQAEQDVEIKKQIVFALKRMGTPRAIAKLYEIARGGSDVEVRKDAIHWIGQRGDAQAVDFLTQIYDAESNDEIKGQVIFGLTRTTQKSALRKLLDIARNDKSLEMRKQAIFWLGRSEDPEAAKFLEELLK